MSTSSNDFEMEEASADDFTITTTGTVYSKEYTVGMYAELKIAIKATYTSQSGATIDTVIQMYDRVTNTWHDHATTFTQLTDDGNEDKDFTSFANKIRAKVTAGGTFGTTPDESVAFVIGANGKGST